MRKFLDLKIGVSTMDLKQAISGGLQTIMRVVVKNFNQRHRIQLREHENILRLFISIFILYIFSRALLETNLWLGLSFILAGCTAIWYGYVYRRREVMYLVLVGVIIGTLVTLLAPNTWQALSTGDIFSFIVILGLMIYLFRLSSKYKKGKYPNEK